MNEFILALLRCNKIGNTKIYEFIKNNKFNYDNMKNNLKKLIDDDDYKNFNNYLVLSKKEIENNKKLGINIITILDDKFPTKLFTTVDPILYLYYKGNIDLLNHKSIAVIGTRKPNDDSIKYTELFTKEIVKNDFVVISGLALGIDKVGHQTAINNKGKTIAVLPVGLDNIQPISNRKLAEDILKHNGCLVSEYSVGTTLNTFNYAKRDRIQTALANAIFVSEAEEKSGTMIAVNKALKENKPVYQLEINNNKIIKNDLKTDLSDINNLFISAEDNYKKETKKEDFINKKIEEQISLF